MTAAGGARDFAASVHRRLLNRAREEGTSFNLLLQRYTIERFLFRLSLSSVVDVFTLKGATLLLIWVAHEFRPTRDVDVLSAGPTDHTSIRRAMEAVCTVPCIEDGVVFDHEQIRMNDIRGEHERGGVRVKLPGRLGRTRLHLQVDIGFGDPVTPARQMHDYPTLLDHPAPRLWTYPRETFVAEKCEAIVRRGARNSRVKDYWDVACIASNFAFDGETLRSAIDETFRRCGTELTGERPDAFQPAFYETPMHVRRWQEFQRQVEEHGLGTARFVDVGEEIRQFLGPLFDSLIDNEPFTLSWPAGGPWQPATGRSEGRDFNG